MNRILAIVVLLCCPLGSASAKLLAEFSWQIPTPVVAPARYEISRWAGYPGPFMVWGTDTSDLYGTFQAPADIVDVFNLGWTTGNGAWSTIRSDVFDDVNKWQGPLTNKFGLGLAGLLWNGYSDHGWRGAAFVPQLGPAAFEGYKITGLVRSVTPSSQTIRVFGEVVPEPASWVLVGMAFAMFSARRTR